MFTLERFGETDESRVSPHSAAREGCLALSFDIDVIAIRRHRRIGCLCGLVNTREPLSSLIKHLYDLLRYFPRCPLMNVFPFSMFSTNPV